MLQTKCLSDGDTSMTADLSCSNAAIRKRYEHLMSSLCYLVRLKHSEAFKLKFSSSAVEESGGKWTKQTPLDLYLTIISLFP